jgi:hypothetical protein
LMVVFGEGKAGQGRVKGQKWQWNDRQGRIGLRAPVDKAPVNGVA